MYETSETTNLSPNPPPRPRGDDECVRTDIGKALSEGAQNDDLPTNREIVGALSSCLRPWKLLTSPLTPPLAPGAMTNALMAGSRLFLPLSSTHPTNSSLTPPLALLLLTDEYQA